MNAYVNESENENKYGHLTGVIMKLSESEWQVMNALWKQFPATARQIMNHIPDEINWAYTTVKTLLSRLVEKKAVTERKQGNTSVYEPLISQHSARQGALRSMVDKVLGGTVQPMMHFLAEERNLTEKQRRQLKQLLDEMDQTAEEE